MIQSSINQQGINSSKYLLVQTKSKRYKIKTERTISEDKAYNFVKDFNYFLPMIDRTRRQEIIKECKTKLGGGGARL